MKNYTRVCVRIDLDAIEYNIEMMKANIQDGVKMLAVIKTDGYLTFIHIERHHTIDKYFGKTVIINTVDHVIQQKSADQNRHCRDKYRLEQYTDL